MKVRPQQIRRRNTMLRELSEMVADALRARGVSEQEAREASEEIAFAIHHRWKGITFTFPARDELARARLKNHLIKEYNGTNADELVRRYGVTEDFIYSVLREHRLSKTSTEPEFDF